MSSLLQKLEGIVVRRQEVAKMIVDPDVISDMKRYPTLSKEYKDLEPIEEAFNTYKNILDNIASAKEVVETESDQEFRDMAKAELQELEAKLPKMEEKVRFLLIPQDPNDSKNALVELRAGTGGDEASIFAGDLYRMYTRFCDKRGWKMELVDMNEGTSGGFKEIIFNVNGPDVYGDLKYEAGVHRVQRVPQTETQGRVHTSAATVIVLPEADEFDVHIDLNDIRKDTYCSSGPGGQSVNTTYSAVRLTHTPTGIVAQCQDQKSQLKNYEKALTVLRSRIYEIELEKRLAEEATVRKSMVSSGDRSAKVRTYNYPQGRVTDHRIDLTLYDLPNIMNGDIQEIVDALKMAENTALLKEGGMA